MIANSTANNKRIAKNTSYLYFRMLFTTVLSLYTARVVLKVLGVEDFGIYNVVGGVVNFMGFLTATLSSATQRYLTYYLGKEDGVKYQQMFSLLINVYLIFCVVAVIILEVAGPLYISRFMTIPPERIKAAQCVFHFSLITFLVNTFSVPYRSSLIAYEKMGAYAYIGIAEAVLYLGIAIAISYTHIDHLIIYALLMSIVSITVLVAMCIYCRKKLEYCRYVKCWNWDSIKELISYSGWNLFGSLTGVMNLQGQAMVLNYFFGPLVNAAKAVADKVYGIINQFSQNFYMAVTPQIIKTYAAGDIDQMRSLVLNSSRYSFFMLLVISAPLIVVIEPLLEFWLGEEQISKEMLKFCQYMIVYSLVNVLEQPITMAVRATGNIKKYQVVVGLITLTFIPLCIFIFMLGAPVYTSILLMSLIFFIALIFRIYIVSSILQINMSLYFYKVILPILFVLAVACTITVLVVKVFVLCNEMWLFEAIVSFLITLLSCLLCGLNKREKELMIGFVCGKIKNNK